MQHADQLRLNPREFVSHSLPAVYHTSVTEAGADDAGI